MTKERKSRHSIIILFMASAGLLLIARLVMLTGLQSDKWTSYAEDMSMRAVYETGARGDIVDRNGEIIAGSRPVYSVIISRVDIDKEEAMTSAANVLAFLEDAGEDITVTSEDLIKKLEDRGYMSYMPVVLAEDVTKETAKFIDEKNFRGVHISKNYVRDYPHGALASHIVGYMGRISGNEEELIRNGEYRNDALIGKAGIEKVYEQQLVGTDSVSTFQVDSMGKVTKLLGKSSTQKGEDVKLTIDLRLQKTAEDALERAIEQARLGGTFESKYGDHNMVYAKNAASGAAVALDVETGQVLAMASFPDYDPGVFTEGISEKQWKELQQKNINDPLSPAPLYNVATLCAVQPGSTFKPVTALTALECGLDAQMELYDGGRVKMGGRSFGCHLWNNNGSSHGYVDLIDAMKVSCNYYFFDIACGRDLTNDKSLGYKSRISNEKIASTARALGLGEKTGIQIDESSGTLPSEKLKNKTAKSALRDSLLYGCEEYFKPETALEGKKLEENIEKIVELADKDLTLEEIIGKLGMIGSIKNEKIKELAELCKYTYFDMSKWTSGDTLNISIGQGDNGYTPLQMARYIAALGNGGVKEKVSLTFGEDEIEIFEEGEESNSAQKSPFSEEDLEKVIEAMSAVTKDPQGSLYGMFSSFPYEVAAKTGTAQRMGKINTKDERDYLRRHLHLIAPDVGFEELESEAERLMKQYPDIFTSEDAALRRAVMNLSELDITSDDIDIYKEDYDNFAWTVALAPADEPQIAVAVMLVQGKASSNAAPIVREIVGEYGEISRWEKSF